ncbi:carbohydrate-binding protein [Streptomyces sp. NPDC051776]|uniref:carbohydrate-binding protein n=1 Tax=Streptomyces sp. NPDC051776 TaxID=3155414 RepID=UPI00343AFFB5
MTAGNNGTGTPDGSGTPENDDPFAYLYRSEDGDGGTPATAAPTGGYGYPGPAQPGVPRTSYNQVSRVGERRYGQGQYAPGQQAHAQQTNGQQAQYGQQANPHYAAPETLPGGQGRSTPPPGDFGGRRGGRGPNNRGLLIGAIAVVAVVVVAIGVAIVTNSGEDSQGNEASGTESSGPAESVKPGTGKADKPLTDLPREDAASLRVDSPAATASDFKGAKSSTGAYVGMNGPGATATWNTKVGKAGQYRLYVRYGVPGKNADLTLSVNGKPDARPLNMENFAHAPEGDWEKGWANTWALVTLDKGTNTIKLSCEAGNQCEVNLDKVALRSKKAEAPAGW